MFDKLKALGNTAWLGVKALAAKIIDVAGTIFGVVLAIGTIALGIWAYLTKTKADSQAALDANAEDKKKLDNLDQQIDQNNQKAAELEKKIKEDDKDVSTDELVKFFNQPPNDPDSKS